MIDFDAIEAAMPLIDVKRHLRVEGNEEDELIQQLIYAAAETIQHETGHLIGRQAVTAYAACWSEIRLRAWPIWEVQDASYRQRGDATTIQLPTDMVVIERGRRPARVSSAAGPWPAHAAARDAVAVTYIAGHDPEEVPYRLRSALNLMVADLYGQRESWTAGTATAVPMSLTVHALLKQFRIRAL
jgi:uncharacterized phiE125 gp8 family phage protein